MEHPSEALVEVLHVGTVGFPGVTAAFQKVGLGNSAPHRCNQVCTKLVGSVGLVTVTNPVAVHLKDLDRGDVWVFNQVVELQVGAEGGLLGVEGGGTAVGDVATAHGCLCSAEITEERISVGGWYMAQEPGDCGEYLERKSSRKG